LRATTSSKLVSLRHSSTLKRRFSIQPPCLSGEDMRTKGEHLLRRVKRGEEHEEFPCLLPRKLAPDHVRRNVPPHSFFEPEALDERYLLKTLHRREHARKNKGSRR